MKGKQSGFIYECLSYRYDHAVTLANGSAASEEGDDEDNGAHGYEERRHGKEGVVKEMLILVVHSMDYQTDWQ